MACQTGIRADKDLKNFLEECKRGKIRLAKFVINKEHINVNFHAPYSDKKSWADEWKANLPGCVDSYEPCFLLFRLDSIHDWALISFADDKAPTRDKMLLAATKATFKNEFGLSFIKHDIQASNPSDLDVEKVKRRLEGAKITDVDSRPAAQVDLPYTHIERELSTVSKDKANMPQPKAPAQLLRGVLFPIDQDAIELLKAFAQGHMDFVQLSVDTLNEAIKLESHKNQLSANQLGKEISKQKPRYTLFRFREADGEPVFFIYSVPQSVTCTIKEKMLFSSCKAPFINEIQKECGVKISKKIEVDSRDKMDGPTLLSYINPMLVQQEPQKFDRPARPGRPRTTVPT